jgi:hypothetical protein
MAEIEKILILGDSFAAKWPEVDHGWVNLLEKDFNIINLAQAGVGEYKILKQLENAPIVDLIIVSHTSPGRVHTWRHPLHKKGFHQNCDLIYNDIVDRFDLFNVSLKSAKLWFEYHYDDEYQIEIYNLLRAEINRKISLPYISISHLPITASLAIENNHIDFSEFWEFNRGNANHYTKEANQIVYQILKTYIVNELINV